MNGMNTMHWAYWVLLMGGIFLAVVLVTCVLWWILAPRLDPKRVVRYAHHGKMVAVRADLKGQHRKHCLCYGCGKFYPGAGPRCPIAQATFDNCVKFGTVTPVWECPEYTPDDSHTPNR